MSNSTPAHKAQAASAQTAKAETPAKPKILSALTRKVKTQPKVISRQVFSDFASI